MRKSPSYPRTLLGGTIKRHRTAAGLTQTQLAAMVGMDQPKIARIEKAARGTTYLAPADLNRIFDALKFSHELAEELHSYARAPYDQGGTWVESGSQEWWNGQLRAEALARVYLSYHGESWDGLIQNERYMRRQFELGRRTNIQAATTTRLNRQRHVFDDSAEPGDFQFVVSEAALYRDMGDPATLAAQLEHVLTLMGRPYMTILIVPFGAPVPTQVADFTVMRFRSQVMSDLVLVQHQVGAVIVDDDKSVVEFQSRWDVIHAALGPRRPREEADRHQDSRRLIEQRLDQIRAE